MKIPVKAHFVNGEMVSAEYAEVPAEVVAKMLLPLFLRDMEKSEQE